MRRTSLTRAHAAALAAELRRIRTARSLSMRRLAALSGVNKATVIMLERGDIPTPQPDTLMLLARALDTPVIDLFLVAGWLTADELPSLSVYLRSRFPDLDDQQITDAANYLAALPHAPVR